MMDPDHDEIVQLSKLFIVLQTLGNFTKKETRSIFHYFDINSDGEVDQIDFMQMVKNGMNGTFGVPWMNKYKRSSSIDKRF